MISYASPPDISDGLMISDDLTRFNISERPSCGSFAAIAKSTRLVLRYRKPSFFYSFRMRRPGGIRC